MFETHDIGRTPSSLKRFIVIIMLCSLFAELVRYRPWASNTAIHYSLRVG